ncbi:MAG: hypothetical protein A3J06_00490 [Candidatus Moranbacteria bacterium RIFCSPLOWO2_02_FULL_48_19]|nr:MAG: hypothetical protein A3J06_00490 [Candidatus Moranbacteria bacterium RIFCSPLOWO2_02_FULL_48_19]
MQMLNQYFIRHLKKMKQNGFLAVCYALLLEALLIGYLGFMALFTIEMILPTFVAARFSLTKFFFLLFLFSFVLTALGRYLDMSFEWKITKKSPLLWLGFLWTLFILLLSLYKFPPFIIPIIILAFFAIGYLFWKILFGFDKDLL